VSRFIIWCSLLQSVVSNLKVVNYGIIYLLVHLYIVVHVSFKRKLKDYLVRELDIQCKCFFLVFYCTVVSRLSVCVSVFQPRF